MDRVSRRRSSSSSRRAPVPSSRSPSSSAPRRHCAKPPATSSARSRSPRPPTDWSDPLARAMTTVAPAAGGAPIDKITMQFKGDQPTVTDLHRQADRRRGSPVRRRRADRRAGPDRRLRRQTVPQPAAQRRSVRRRRAGVRDALGARAVRADDHRADHLPQAAAADPGRNPEGLLVTRRGAVRGRSAARSRSSACRRPAASRHRRRRAPGRSGPSARRATSPTSTASAATRRSAAC